MSYYQCEAWEVEAGAVHDEYDDNNGVSLICPVFCIEIFASIASHQPTMTQQLFVPQQQLTQAWSAISSKLSQMNIPFNVHATVTQKIIACARRSAAVNERQSKSNRKNIIAIVVTLCPVRPLTTSDLEVLGRRRGASKEAIDGLEKVGEGLIKEQYHCVICLEEMKKEGCRMPCSHVYHHHCIIRWLQTSNLCPLCRFQMPT